MKIQKRCRIALLCLLAILCIVGLIACGGDAYAVSQGTCNDAYVGYVAE